MSYVPRPYDGDVLAVFLDRDERYAIWKPLLGSTADFRFVESDHTGLRGLFVEPALTNWIEMLRFRLDAAD